MQKVENGQLGPILVVDDERFFQDLMAGILEHEGYRVHVVGNGEEALKACSEGRYQVVVMDLVLPDIMGTEVLARVKERTPISLLSWLPLMRAWKAQLRPSKQVLMIT